MHACMTKVVESKICCDVDNLSAYRTVAEIDDILLSNRFGLRSMQHGLHLVL